MKITFGYIITVLLIFTVGPAFIWFGVKVMGHQSSAAFELGLGLVGFGLFPIVAFFAILLRGKN